MGLSTIKKIISLEQNALFEKIQKLLDEEMIVAYTVEVKPLTIADYTERLEKAERQIKKGNYLTQEQAEKAANDW